MRNRILVAGLLACAALAAVPAANLQAQGSAPQASAPPASAPQASAPQASAPQASAPQASASQASASQASGSPAEVIAARRAGLKRMGQHADAIKHIVDGHEDVAPVVARADDMISWFRQFPSLFPPGSDQGDTKAAPAIWSDRAGFEQANALVLTRLETLRGAAQSGDQAAVATAFQGVGQACGNCHRSYRQR